MQIKFPTIPAEVLEEFHMNFQGDTESTFRLCKQCRGKCEYSKVSSLVPGEAEFMARKMELSLADFRAAHLDGVRVDGLTIDILKCSDPCPFLDEARSCSVRYYKPIMCLIYPICFSQNSGRYVLAIDAHCPLAKDEEILSYFVDKGIPLVKTLNIPAAWTERVYRFDDYDYDYSLMLEQREVPIDQYHVYELEELLGYRV